MKKDLQFILKETVAQRTNTCRICDGIITPKTAVIKFATIAHEKSHSELAICPNCYKQMRINGFSLSPLQFKSPYGNGRNTTKSACIQPFDLLIQTPSLEKALHLNTLGFTVRLVGIMYRCTKHCNNAYFGKSEFTLFADDTIRVNGVRVQNYDHWRALVTGEVAE